jgi:hypothetical protein
MKKILTINYLSKVFAKRITFLDVYRKMKKFQLIYFVDYRIYLDKKKINNQIRIPKKSAPCFFFFFSTFLS